METHALELIGTVKLIEPEQTFSSGFSKREFVITTEEKFPQDVKMECVKEKVEQLAGLSLGDQVKVSFNVRGNEYKGRYYVNLQAWRVHVLDKVKHDTHRRAEQRSLDEEVPGWGGSDDEDVPFAPFRDIVW